MKSATARRKYGARKPVRVARSKPDEQTELLQQILAELRRLNANLEKTRPAQAGPQEIDHVTDAEEEEDDSEELEYFE